MLLGLADDDDHNVQEAAIAGLASAAGRDADSVYIRALGSSGNQVALAAATALEGTTDTAAALPALLQAFDDLSARRSENARDPRVAILTRIGDLGSTATASRLTPYLADFDTTVAVQVATLFSKWRGSTVSPRPAPLPIRAEPLARLFTSPPARLRVTMAPSSGGGSFTVRLWADETPATVARVLRLAHEGFYDGKVFQRVEPNFVIQGGGPDANEYVGDNAFMRDELTMRTHARGTVGISARGRDTGDGQWFVNLVDNPLLDHEFTIFGRIDGGQAVAERLLEGDRIARVEVVESPTGADHWLMTADSVRLYYRIVGTGTETVVAPLALFHAGQLDALARNRRLVLYDPRGRGRSDTVSAAKVSLDRNVADLDAIRAAVGAERIALIGWSGLGMELFVYALRHPDRVTRLVQLAPVAPRWTPWSDSLATDRARRTDSTALSALRARERRGVYRDNPANHCRAIAAVYSPPTFGDPTRAHLAPDVCGRPTEWPERINGYFTALMSSIEGFDWTNSLAKVAGIPRLVIHGALDNTPVNGNREWVAGQPNARILIVDGAGHWPHYERSDEVLPALDEFLGGGWPDGSAAIP